MKESIADAIRLLCAKADELERDTPGPRAARTVSLSPRQLLLLVEEVGIKALGGSLWFNGCWLQVDGEAYGDPILELTRVVRL